MQCDESPSDFQTLPRTTFMKASQTTIKKSPTASEWRPLSASKQRLCVFVDRGTDAGPLSEAPIIGPEKPPPFEAVFAVIEDLVIHIPFDHNTPNRILERVISSYKNGSYPIYPPSLKFETSNSASPTDADEPPLRPPSRLTAETDDDYFHQSHEFDPYAANNYANNIKQSQPQHELAPPTPTLTPPPTANDAVEKFVNSHQ